MHSVVSRRSETMNSQQDTSLAMRWPGRRLERTTEPCQQAGRVGLSSSNGLAAHHRRSRIASGGKSDRTVAT